MDIQTDAAPAQPTAAEPTTVSAAESALEKDDFLGFQDARRAERQGKPLPDVTPAPAPERGISKRQQDINDRAQKAVEAATATLREENARLRQLTERPAPAPAPVATAPAPTTEKFLSLDAWSKENPNGSLEDYVDARADFRDQQRAEATRTEQAQRARIEDLTTRGQHFAQSMSEALKAEPDLATKIPPAMTDERASIPLSALSGEQLKTATFSNLVAEAAFRSDRPAELLKYLHSHQDELVHVAQIERQYGPHAALGALLALDRNTARTPAATPDAPVASSPSPVSAFPAPTPTLTRAGSTKDPEAAAIKSDDFSGYAAARRAARLANVRQGMA